jgi:stage V sporulation protein SpoVS
MTASSPIDSASTLALARDTLAIEAQAISASVLAESIEGLAVMGGIIGQGPSLGRVPALRPDKIGP